MIYNDGQLAMFEFDAKFQKVYTENLGYIARLFLDHKNVNHELDSFNFYILCEIEPDGYHFVGYFSKEKENQENNLSCIMVLPNKQRYGYGKFIIDFSYKLSLIEKKHGSPEKPLSDLGHRTYVGYWTHRILDVLLEQRDKQFSIENISEKTGISPLDIQETLECY